MGDGDGVALVTGAGRRLGREIALGLGRAGYDVAVHYGSSRDAAVATVAELERLDRRAWAIGADLADLGAIGGLFDDLVKRAGRLDVLVNNASSFHSRPFDEVTPEDWGRSIDVNLRAPFFCMQRAAREMRRLGGRGAIVNMGDLSGVDPWVHFAAHGTSKAGLLFLTRAAARELGPEVRVNAVVPGPILPPPGQDPSDESWQRRGDQLPLRRTGGAQHVVEAVLYLVGAEYVTGVALPVDGGERLAPTMRR